MKYKGYELVIDIDEDNGCMIVSVPSIGAKMEDYAKGTSTNEFMGRRLINWFYDAVDLHIGRSAERETCEKRIDPEEVAKNIYYKHICLRYDEIGDKYGYWDKCTNQDYFRGLADRAISCIKKIDPSIISDDINHGKKHEFKRETIARLAWEDPQYHEEMHTWEELNEPMRKEWREKSDRIISYIEEVIYG
jgi:hypothetical protein